ncbi:MAG: TonB-dependent receptor [Marinilabiliales bacterium]
MKKLIIIIISSVFISCIYSQNATVRGKVYDKKTGEELIGATIFIEGTKTGTITDFDGNYNLEIAPGIYNIQCSFISYETVVIKDFILKAGDIKVINFQLGEAMLALNEVTVKAKVVKETEVALLTMQKKSAVVMNGVSAEEISRSGDNDAAKALKRVSGISIEGGKYVYIRGLSDRYSKTTLNKAEIPGLDPNRNTVQMDLFPSNIIDNLVVYKSFSPDLPGDFAGGYVNIATKDFPERFTLQFSSSFGYNSQSSFNKDFITYTGGKLDFLGMDDGSRNWPIKHVNEIPYLYQDNDKLDEITRSFNKEMDISRATSFMNHAHSISLGNQVKLFNKAFGYVTAISYQRNYNYYNDGITGRYELNGAGEESLNKERLLNVEEGDMEVLIGAMLNVSFKLTDNNKIGFTIIRNQSGDKTARNAFGEKPSDEIGMFQQTRELEFVERSISSGQLKGEHFLKNFHDIKIEWISSFTYSMQKEPDKRNFINSYYINDTSYVYMIEKSKYSLPARYTRIMSEYNNDNKVDIIIPYRFMGLKSKFKFGGSYLWKDRDFNESRIDIGSQNNSFTGSIAEYLQDDNIGQAASGTYGVYLINATDLKNNYHGTQTVSSGYIMTDMYLVAALRMIAGIRIESTEINVASHDKEKKTADIVAKDLLPGFNMTYEVNKKMNVRAAYSKTIARPTFRELAPYASYDFETGETKIGNPDLKRTNISNIDLRWEYFPEYKDIISLGFFYKYFKNPIEKAFNPIAMNPELTWKNVEQAFLYGGELEIRKTLDFISVFKNYSIGLNFTYVQSQTEIDSLELVAIHATDPDHPSTREMFGQAPFILNTILGYNNDSIGLSANLSYNVEGAKMVVVIVSGTPNIYEQPRHLLNFNMRKKIGKNISVKFSVKNILNSKTELTYTYNNIDYNYQRFSTGRTFSFGFNYLIK